MALSQWAEANRLAKIQAKQVKNNGKSNIPLNNLNIGKSNKN